MPSGRLLIWDPTADIAKASVMSLTLWSGLAPYLAQVGYGPIVPKTSAPPLSHFANSVRAACSRGVLGVGSG